MGSAATKGRVVRVSDVVWEAAMRKAASEGRRLSDVMRGMLAEYAGLPDETGLEGSPRDRRSTASRSDKSAN